MVQAILRLPAVKAQTGLSRSSIYAYISEKKFPAPIQLGARAVGWISTDVEAWVQARIDTSKKDTRQAV